MGPKLCRFVVGSLLVVAFCVCFAKWFYVKFSVLQLNQKCEVYRNKNYLHFRVSGGSKTDALEYTHQAWLGYAAKPNATETKIEFRCGGSLISEQYVLTAAHCDRPKIVRLGYYNERSQNLMFYRDFKVLKFTTHDEYSPTSSYHDIALIKLARKVEFSRYIRPACLLANAPFNLTTVLATGFGQTGNGDVHPSSQLMVVQLDILNSTECEEKFGYGKKFQRGIIPEQLCVGSLEGTGKDTCEGDSGSPLQVPLKSKVHHIVGITTVGNIQCGVGNSAAVYTRVTSYLDWIEGIVWPKEFKETYPYDWVFPTQTELDAFDRFYKMNSRAFREHP